MSHSIVAVADAASEAIWLLDLDDDHCASQSIRLLYNIGFSSGLALLLAMNMNLTHRRADAALLQQSRTQLLV